MTSTYAKVSLCFDCDERRAEEERRRAEEMNRLVNISMCVLGGLVLLLGVVIGVVMVALLAGWVGALAVGLVVLGLVFLVPLSIIYFRRR